MWQAVKDKKRRLAQNYKERRRSSTGEEMDVARSIPYDADFVDNRGEFKEYLRTTKEISKKVQICTNAATAFIEAFKCMAECFDQMEGGCETSRGEHWLENVDRFHASACAQMEGSTLALLEVLGTRYQAVQETQAGIKKLIDRETDLRSYERRVHEATNAAKPKPETIQKFTTKRETAKNDCIEMTTTTKADLEYMNKTNLTAHQPSYNDYFDMLGHVLSKCSELANADEARATLQRLASGGGGSSMAQAKGAATAAAGRAKMAATSGMASMSAMAGLTGAHGAGKPMLNAPPKRAAPVPGGSERRVPPVPFSSESPPPLPPKQGSSSSSSMSSRASAGAMAGFSQAQSGMSSAKQQARQHKEQASKEQKAAATGMAMGFMTGGKSGALKSAKSSATTAAKSHGTEVAKNIPPSSGPPSRAAPTPQAVST